MADERAAHEARGAFDAWQDAWNAQDLEGMVAKMHFPHVRLANGAFTTFETADDFRATHAAAAASLEAEGWDQTLSESVEAVQSGPEKVHLAIRQSRRHADGSEYKPFDTLWIFTLIDGSWGVKFRSSYLAS